MQCHSVPMDAHAMPLSAYGRACNATHMQCHSVPMDAPIIMKSHAQCLSAHCLHTLAQTQTLRPQTHTRAHPNAPILSALIPISQRTQKRVRLHAHERSSACCAPRCFHPLWRHTARGRAHPGD